MERTWLKTQEKSANSVIKTGWQGDALGTHPTREWKFSTVVILTDTSTSNLETTQANNLAAGVQLKVKEKLCIIKRKSLPPSRGYRNFYAQVLSEHNREKEKEVAIKKLVKMRNTAQIITE